MTGFLMLPLAGLILWLVMEGSKRSTRDHKEDLLDVFERDRAAGMCYDMSREVEDG